MINKVYILEKDGKLNSYTLNKIKIQNYIDGVRDSLSVKYFDLERKCNRDSSTGSSYRELFSRNIINLPINLFKKEYIAVVEDYEYYQDVLFDEKFIVLSGLRARIRNDWEFRYLVEDSREKIPYPVSQLIKKTILSNKEEFLNNL